MARSVVSKGIAEVTATVVEGRSVLSRLVHASPLRVQPMPTAAAQRAGAAAAVIASVGGGLLGDDDVSVAVSVDSDATLWIGTQSSTKVYKKRRRPFWTGQSSSKTRVRVEARVAEGGLLVWAPDPTVPYRCSSFASNNVFRIDPGGSLVSVDWVQAGRSRMSGGERWVFDSYTSRTKWVMQGSRIVDAVELDGDSRHSFDINGPREAAATVAVAGPRAAAVAARLRAAAIDMAQRTGARVTGIVEPIELSAQVTLGVSTIGDFSLARLVAADTEDVYRLLRHCLGPLSEYLGLEPYADRVYAAPSPPPPLYVNRDDEVFLDLAPPQGGIDHAADALAWLPSALQLADSALPTGGFAHSGGLEAASQLGLIRKNDEQALLAFLTAASKNHASLYVRIHAKLHTRTPLSQAPFAKAATEADANLTELDATLDEHLKAHAPARLASRRQAAAIVRIAEVLGVSIDADHGAVAFGALAAALELPGPAAILVFAHSATRDACSAAVRLGLLGPLRAVALQAKILAYQTRHLLSVYEALDPNNAATNAPLLDAAHAAHPVLEMRLFQT